MHRLFMYERRTYIIIKRKRRFLIECARIPQCVAPKWSLTTIVNRCSLRCLEHCAHVINYKCIANLFYYIKKHDIILARYIIAYIEDILRYKEHIVLHCMIHQLYNVNEVDIIERTRDREEWCARARVRVCACERERERERD